jgi:hypothetical protein
MREMVKQTVEEYAEKTGNYALLNMLKRYEGFQGNKPMPSRRSPAKSLHPILPEKERDYASIFGVIARLGRPAGSADFGKYRRRWLDYPPRDPSSGYRNRLDDVLASMVKDGVLKAIRTAKGALAYSPGPNQPRT